MPDDVLPLLGLRILVVDDDAFVRALLQELLRTLGALASGVESGDAAVAVLGEPGGADLDGMLCDLEMPGMDGFTLLRQIREGRTAAPVTLPVVAITAYRHSQVMEEATRAGASALLVKPVTRDNLIDALPSLRGGRGVPGR